MRWMPSFKALKEHVKIYLDTEERERKEGRKEGKEKEMGSSRFPQRGGKKKS